MGPPQESAEFPRVWEELKRWGLLLLTDARLPSVASLVAGEPVRGSWWAHPQAHAIFRVASRLDEHPDVTVAKLVSGKVTYAHRKLWPALAALGSARESWQVQGLSRMGRALLARVLKEGQLRTDRLFRWRVPFDSAQDKPAGAGREGSRGGKSKAVGEAARELERRLLVHGEEFHTETGAHAKWLESWGHWARRV